MKPWAAVLLISLLWAALYLPFLGAIELRGEEPRRILPARTMLESGDWIVPKIGGAIYRKKPPLINWSIAVAFAVTGVQAEWSARLPSVLWIGAFGVVAALALRRRFGDWGALSTGLFFMTTVAMMDKGRMAEMEAMYAAQTGIAFVLWAAWWSEKKHWAAFTVPWIFLGLGMLTKGPVHLLLFYGLVIPSLVFSRRLRDLWSPPHLSGLLLMTLVFLPWTLAYVRLTSGTGDTAAVWANEMSERFRWADVHPGAWVLRPLQILGDFLPWTPLLLLCWWKATPLPAAGPEDDRWNHLIRGTRWGLLGGLAVLLLLPQGAARYAQPLFPAACVLLVDHWLGLTGPRRVSFEINWRLINRIALPLVAVAAGLAALVVPLVMEAPWGPGAVTASAALGLALWNRFHPRSRDWPPLVWSALIMAAAAATILSHLGPQMERQGEYQRTGRELAAAAPDPDRPVVFFKPRYFRSLFYVRRPYTEIDRVSRLPTGSAYLILPVRELDDASLGRFLAGHEVEELQRTTWETREFAVLRIDPRSPASEP